ncbi:MAG TPA: hypothetical protein VGR11_10125, partial [Solirubrobacteraceae bacterium]|nr:hypothetical protein [Solirubrobacteraceae bacterium]
MALAADGAILTWGLSVGRDSAGNPDYRWSELPAPVDGLPPVVALAAGDYHHLALDASGAVHAWGANSFGACGDHDHGMTFRRPAPIDGLPAVRALAAAGSTSLALTAAGRLVAWGYNSQGA